MPGEIPLISPSTVESCTYRWACLLCEEQPICRKDKVAHSRWLVQQRLMTIRHTVLLLSPRGGVGKSTVTANLAVGLALFGNAVGIVDLDAHRSPVRSLLGGHETAPPPLRAAGHELVPFHAYTIAVASLAGLPSAGPAEVQTESPACLPDGAGRDALASGGLAMRTAQLIGGVDWAELDYLLVDLPPGMGQDVWRTIEVMSPVLGCLIVTNAQEMALAEAGQMAEGLIAQGLPVIGLVENMSLSSAPSSAPPEPKSPARGTGWVVAQIPLDPEVAASGEAGRPFVMVRSDRLTAQAYQTLAGRLDDFAGKGGAAPRKEDLCSPR